MRSPVPRRLRPIRIFALGLLALGLAGCVSRTQDGDATLFRFEAWVPVSAGVGAVVGTAAGVLLRRGVPRLGWPLLLLGPLALVCLVPGLAMDNVRVTPKDFRLEVGFWFSRNIHEVKFENVSAMQIVVEEKWSGRRRSKSTYLVCQLKSGGADKVPVGDIMKNGGLAAILDQAQSRGIPVDAPQGP